MSASGGGEKIHLIPPQLRERAVLDLQLAYTWDPQRLFELAVNTMPVAKPAQRVAYAVWGPFPTVLGACGP